MLLQLFFQVNLGHLVPPPAPVPEENTWELVKQVLGM